MRIFVIAALVAACSSYVPGAETPANVEVPSPTVDDPFRGLPAISRNRKVMALPHFVAGPAGSRRAVTFVGVADEDSGGRTVEIPSGSAETVIRQLAAQLAGAGFTKLPWVATPDVPPMPMTLTIAGTELAFSRDDTDRVVMTAGSLGSDLYAPPAPVVAVAATIVWTEEHGHAYVRYDLNVDGARDSEWRVVTLTRNAK